MNKKIQAIKDSFKNKDLFEQALTHRSWINENDSKRMSNERLEFLGDAVLEFVVSSYLFEKLPDRPEGFLTPLRSNFVNTRNLSELAKKLELGELLYMSKGEEQGGGRNNKTLLANTVEALVGAMFLDQGLDITTNFIKLNLLADLPEKLSQPLKDAKSRLQETAHTMGLRSPIYKILKESGPDHAKHYKVQVNVAGKFSSGEGRTIHEAEQNAASGMLEAFEVID